MRFDEFVLDPESRQLFRAGAEVHLARKAFDLLDLLVQERPRALAKSRLQAHLWPSTAVVEANLSNLVGELRAALGDDPREPRYVRTVYGFGYAFCGEINEEKLASPGAPLACRLVWERQEIPLLPGENVLGRSADAGVCIDSEGVSRRHARIVVEGDRAVLEDLGSKNGTWHRGLKIREAVTLVTGDEIRVGRATLRFRIAASESTTTVG